MLFKLTQKEIRSIGNAEKFWNRLDVWQKENNCTGIPSAATLKLERIGYSSGVYGCNGSLFRDIENGELIGVAGRNYAMYCD